MAFKRVEALELGRDDETCEGLAAATWGFERKTSVSIVSCIPSVFAYSTDSPCHDHGNSIQQRESNGCVPDMSVTSTWIAWRRCVIASRIEASVIWDMSSDQGDLASRRTDGSDCGVGERKGLCEKSDDDHRGTRTSDVTQVCTE